MPYLFRPFSLACVAACIALPAAAQDVALEPAYGTVTLDSSWYGNTHSVTLQSGGEVDASHLGSPCVGYIAGAPDVRVDYVAGGYPLYIGAESAADTTLVVHGPDGRWYCDDDTGSGRNPLLSFESALSGQYNIWVGTYGEQAYHAAQLLLSERNDAEFVQEDVWPDGSLYPTGGSASLRSGFTNDPYSVRLYAPTGGPSRASLLGASCTGYTTAAPTFELYFSAGKFPLYLRARSQGDTTLIVRDPNGNWFCDDDSAGDYDPLLVLGRPPSGYYDIWVGSYAQGESHYADLLISELGSGE